MTTQPTAWKAAHPDSVGFYIASVERRADAVRCWTGKHWTAPVMVYDLHLNRGPALDWPEAMPRKGQPIEWLESVVTDAEGFISWGGLQSEPPVHRNVEVEVRLREAPQPNAPGDPKKLRWLHNGGGGDVIAYRPLERNEAVPQPANDPLVERRAEPRGEKVSDDAPALVRSFSTGATRSADTGRYDPEAFLSPIVVERFCEYMNKHRMQPDGTLRAGDNWQKGIPTETYLKGAWRHLLHLWTRRRGYVVQDPLAAASAEEDLCAIMFNVHGLLFELLKDQRRAAVGESEAA